MSEIEEKKVSDQKSARHAADMTLKAQQALALKALTGLLVVGSDLAKAYSNNYAFGEKDHIRAQACALISEAARMEGTPEALKAAAERLLQVSDGLKVFNVGAKAAA